MTPGTGGFRSGQNVPLHTDPEAIPNALHQWDSWLVMAVEEDGKRPIAPNNGRWKGVELLTLPEAHECAKDLQTDRRVRSAESLVLALRLTDELPVVVLDLDVDGETLGEVPDSLQEVGARYVEHSVSGRGLHLVGRGSLDQNLSRTNLPGAPGVSIEAYSHDHLIIFTGDVLEGMNDLVDLNTDVLDGIVDELRGDSSSAGPATGSTEDGTSSEATGETRSVPGESSASGGSLTDLGAKRARTWSRKSRGRTMHFADLNLSVEIVKATGFAFYDGFEDLWNGEDPRNRSDHSAIDFDFVTSLVQLCRGDRKLIDDCYRASRRYTANIRNRTNGPKWDRPIQSSGAKTWGDHLIDRALAAEDREEYQDMFVVPPSSK